MTNLLQTSSFTYSPFSIAGTIPETKELDEPETLFIELCKDRSIKRLTGIYLREKHTVHLCLRQHAMSQLIFITLYESSFLFQGSRWGLKWSPMHLTFYFSNFSFFPASHQWQKLNKAVKACTVAGFNSVLNSYASACPAALWHALLYCPALSTATDRDAQRKQVNCKRGQNRLM